MKVKIIKEKEDQITFEIDDYLILSIYKGTKNYSIDAQLKTEFTGLFSIAVPIKR